MKYVEYDEDLPEGAFIPHDVFYISPMPIRLDGLYYQVNRAGITCRTPSDFVIRRTDGYLFGTIHCVIGGKGSVSVRGNTYSVEKGQLFVLSAYEHHLYRSDPKDPMALVWVEFGGGDSDRMVRHILENGGPIFGGEVFQTVMSLCTSLLYRTNSSAPTVSQTLYEMLIALCKAVDIGNDVHAAKNQAFLDYIDEHLCERLSLAQVAGAFGYHPAYFSSRFTQVGGMPFSQYVLHRKMSRACYWLMTTNWPLDQISQKLGFYDVSHFTQRFKTVTGVTPARYRKDSHGLAHTTDLVGLETRKVSSATAE